MRCWTLLLVIILLIIQLPVLITLLTIIKGRLGLRYFDLLKIKLTYWKLTSICSCKKITKDIKERATGLDQSNVFLILKPTEKEQMQQVISEEPFQQVFLTNHRKIRSWYWLNQKMSKLMFIKSVSYENEFGKYSTSVCVQFNKFLVIPLFSFMFLL